MANADPDTFVEPDPADLRTTFRAPIKLRVDYERMNSFFADYTKNLSKGGTFIKSARPLPIGTQFAFSLSVPALSEPVLLTGEVTWTLSAEAAAQGTEEPGMGIRFAFATEVERLEFERLVGRLFEESFGPDVARGLLAK